MWHRVKTYLAKQYQSLIFRILLYFIFSALIVALVLGWNFANRIKPHFNNEILPNLSQYIQYLVKDIGTPPDLERAAALTQKLPFDLRLEGENISWSSSSRLHNISSYRFQTAPAPYTNYQIGRGGRDHLLLLEVKDYQYLFSVKNNFRRGQSHRHWVLYILLVSVLIILYLAIRRLFRPVQDISKHLKLVGEGRFDQLLTVKGSGELAQLAHGVNDMTVEIKSMLDSKAALLLAISHELRSPITRMRLNLELLEVGDKRQVLIDDVQEMEELVFAILESERLNSRHVSLNRSSFDLADCLDALIAQYFKSCPIDAVYQPLKVNLDETRVKLLIKNLLDNACRYSADSDKAVELVLSTNDSELHLTIKDHGSGVSADELPHLTEPFYRTDSARQRKTGGYGLGLYLCRLIVEAHGGRLGFESSSGEGLKVSIHLPLA